MEIKPLVSIGICLKNAEGTARNVLNYLLDQDFPSELMELIVVDGGSSDNTLLAVKRTLAGTSVRSQVFQEAHGLGFARNIVVKNASGEYIIWVDGDMTLPRDHVRKQIEFMEKNPKIAIAGGRFLGDPKDNLLACLENIEWKVMDYESGESETPVPIRHFCGGTIYRVDAIRTIGGFDENIKGACEDLEAEFRLCKAGWLLYFTTEVGFHDKRRDTWKDIWKENSWYGYGMHYVSHRHGNLVRTSSFVRDFRRCFTAYKLTRRKVVFLLPVLQVFKKIAGLSGFAKAHIDGYGHQG